MANDFERILLFSGGIDSFVAWHYLNKPQTLYFDIDSRYSLKERTVVSNLIPGTIIDESMCLGDREVGEKAYIPFRNLFFALQATKYSDNIYIAGLADDMVSDKNEEIFDQWSAMMTQMEERPIKVMSPFWGMTKSEVVTWYRDYVGNVQPLLGTTSCYNPTEHYCGKCPSCFRKWSAFMENGIKLEFHNILLMQEYVKKAEQGFYHPKRCKEIITSVQTYMKDSLRKA